MLDEWLARIDAFEWLVLTQENMHVEVARFADMYVMGTNQERSGAHPIKSMWFAEVGAPARGELGARLEPFVHGVAKWTAGPAQASDPFHGAFELSFDSSGAGFRGSWMLVREAEDSYREVAEEWIDDPAGSVPLQGSDRTLTTAEAREALQKQLRFTTSNASLLPYVRARKIEAPGS